MVEAMICPRQIVQKRQPNILGAIQGLQKVGALWPDSRYATPIGWDRTLEKDTTKLSSWELPDSAHRRASDYFLQAKSPAFLHPERRESPWLTTVVNSTHPNSPLIALLCLSRDHLGTARRRVLGRLLLDELA